MGSKAPAVEHFEVNSVLRGDKEYRRKQVIAGWRFSPAVLTAAIIVGWVSSVFSQEIIQEEIRVPMAGAEPRGLEGLLVRPNGPGPYPLALINHGSARNGLERAKQTPLSFVPQATEFARRGWASAVVMRRGHGDSGGSYPQACGSSDYVGVQAAAIADLHAVIDYLSKAPSIDVSRILAVGHSTGGMATIALTANPPPGLVGAINFAGGTASSGPHAVCSEEKVIDVYRVYGKLSRLPMLWVYAENDQFFWPELVDKFKDAFTAGGGIVTFVRTPAFGEDGHSLFSSPRGIPIWTPYVDKYLKDQNLILRPNLLPRPKANVDMPKSLSANGRQAFRDYLDAAPHKAFAMSRDGFFGLSSGRRTVDEAKTGALEACKKAAANCSVIAIDDAAVR